MTDTAPAVLERVRLPSAPASEAAALISMIERAAADPNIDVDRVERMYAMYERAAARNAKAAYLAALADMQPNLPVIDKNGTIERKATNDAGVKERAKPTKYALWEDIMEALFPVLSGHGFSLSFRIAQPTPDRIVVTGVLGHRDGHSEETAIALPIDSTGSKNNVQGWGSSVSYGKRYTAGALLNFVARGEDDDGKAAGAIPSAVITDEQADELRRLITETKSDITKFLDLGGVESISDIPADQFDKAKALLIEKKRKGK